MNLTAQEADKLPNVALVDMKLSPEGGLDVNLKIGLNEYNKHFDKLPAVLPTDAGTFGFTLKDSLSNGKIVGQSAVRNISAVVSQPFGGKRISVGIGNSTYLKNDFCSSCFIDEYEYTAGTGLY